MSTSESRRKVRRLPTSANKGQSSAAAAAKAPPPSKNSPQSNLPAKDPAAQEFLQKKQASHYKNMVNARLEKHGAVEEIEHAAADLQRAQKRFREAQARDYQATLHVKMAADAVTSNGVQWTPYDTTWVNRYYELLKFKEQHGHCSVQLKGGGALGKWVSAQRQAYRKQNKGQATSMTQAKLDILNAVGFDWGTPQAAKQPWEDRFQELLAFKEKFGHCNVTQRTEYHPLALWVAGQRKMYQAILDGNQKRTELSDERIRLLEEAGFEWRRHKFKNRRKRKQIDEEEEATAAALESGSV